MGIGRGKKMWMMVKARLTEEELRDRFSTRGDFFFPQRVFGNVWKLF